MKNNKKVFAIIIAAGKGTRIGATDRPKVMFEVLKKPIIGWAIDPLLKLKNMGVIDRIITVVGFLGNQVIDYLGKKSEFVWQKDQLGTAHAVQVAERLIANEEAITIITNGDHALYSYQTYEKMLNRFVDNNLTLAFCVVKSKTQFDNYGRVIRNLSGQITRIAEPPDITEDEAKIEERSTNLYVVDNKWLFSVLGRIRPAGPKNEYYINAIVKLAIDEGKKVEAVEISNNFEAMGINTLEDLAQTEKILRRK